MKNVIRKGNYYQEGFVFTWLIKVLLKYRYVYRM